MAASAIQQAADVARYLHSGSACDVLVQALLDDRFWRRGAYYVRHGELDWSSAGVATKVRAMDSGMRTVSSTRSSESGFSRKS